MVNKIIIDTDPGIDDSMAIQIALASKEFEILGLTTVFGNVDVHLATINALRLLQLANRTEIPVAKGASTPLKGKFMGGVPFVHGDDGQGNTWQPPCDLSPINTPADEFLIEQIIKFPKQVTIAALGPLTNLATALSKKPEIQNLVKEVVFMGGNAFCAGNATPAAEANILSDPDAADIVLGANWPITMIGLDVTHKTMISQETLNEISECDAPLNNYVMRAYQYYLDFFMRVNKIDGTYVHDSSVFAYLIDKNLYKTVKYPVKVETQEGISKGKTWPSIGESDHEEGEALLPWKNRPKVNICIDVNEKRVIKLLKSRLIIQ
ncbi:nucleoside hydrolase [Aquimarina gracilis]|uniref:Nucleoside hydrolase n=1 Tax=Aquimarina gracilis TaxID=874422 RepID=A0ABU5ZZW6_9FLAO|nr:nucleoside hydrolase [Aquimarina gracilis]MEB3347373.1 nucleoside hydrolase [Aquimarina gracilis]